MLSACDYNDVYMNCAIWLYSQYRMFYCDIVSVGSGHTMSLQWSGQCSWTLSKRYHWYFRGSPGDKVWCRSSVAIRSWDVPCVNQYIVPSYSFFTYTCPGKRWDKWKCCIFLIPLNGVLAVCLHVEMVTPVECWHDSFTTLRPHQLCHIQSCWAVDRSNSIINAISVGSSVLLL